jgi:hypothetical protein
MAGLDFSVDNISFWCIIYINTEISRLLKIFRVGGSRLRGVRKGRTDHEYLRQTMLQPEFYSIIIFMNAAHGAGSEENNG